MTCRTIHVCSVVTVLLSAFHFGSGSAPAQSAATVAAGVQPFVDRQELAGAVMLVADKGKVLSVEAVGWADLAARKPMQTDSMFWIASQSKPITAARWLPRQRRTSSRRLPEGCD